MSPGALKEIILCVHFCLISVKNVIEIFQDLIHQSGNTYQHLKPSTGII